VNERVQADLPAGGWKTNAAGTLYKFVNKDAPGGISPCKVALIKEGTVLKVVCKDSLIDLDDSAQSEVTGAFHVGSESFCFACDAPLKDEGGAGGGAFIAKSCPALPSCYPCSLASICATISARQACEDCIHAHPLSVECGECEDQLGTDPTCAADLTKIWCSTCADLWCDIPCRCILG
jgi:hypothetical protein